MRLFFYNLALFFAAPAGRWWLRRHPRYHMRLAAPRLADWRSRIPAGFHGNWIADADVHT